ncbi:hypothetical protein DXC27_09620 [Ruminococcus sp. OM08-7]|nr:hypothetical protein DXC27_09620 [Ruminococcus sp. OM08-7]
MKKISNILMLIFICGMLGLGAYNYQNNEAFFEASFTSLATISVAVFVSFFLVQLKTDKRRQNEKIDKLIYKIQGYLMEESFLLGGEYARKNLILHRSIANKIGYLKMQKVDKEIVEKLNKIESNFKKIRTVYGENYVNQDKLQENYVKLQNYIMLIDDLCDKIHILLS